MSARKAVVEKFYHDMWNKSDTSLVPELFHAGFTFRGSLGPVLVGYDQFAGYVDEVVGALADYTCDILELTEEDDRVVARMLFRGRHRGAFMGFEPTGESVEWHGSAHFTFAGDRIADLWVLGDVHGLLLQLEANRSS